MRRFRFNRAFVIFAFIISACGIFLVYPAAAEDSVTLTADNTRFYPDDKITAVGNVSAVYRDFTINADSAEADLRENLAVFFGGVRLTTKQHFVEGDSLSMNLKTKEWRLENAKSMVEEESFPGGTFGPAFLTSESISGCEHDLKLHVGSLTTCDLDHPHYYFSAREIDIYPDRRIVARKVSLIGLDRRIFTLDSLVIPIRGFRHNLIPQVGSSAEEGMFVKAAYAYSATENHQGYLKLDLMEKRGLGAGVDHSYTLGAGSGQANLYFLADQQLGSANITGRIQHQQQVGPVSVNLTGDYRTNNYLYYPGSTSQNWQAALRHASANSNTALTFRNSATRGITSNERFTTSLRHTQNFNPNLSGVMSMDLRRYLSSNMESADQELDSSIEFRQRSDKFDLSLVASKKFDFSDEESPRYKSYIDRLPELTFNTDTYRLGDSFLPGLPFRLSLTAGKYHEMPTDITSERFLLQMDMLNKILDIGDRSELNVSGGLRQAFYSQDAAQYVAKANSIFTTRFSDHLRSRISYNYQDSRGYSPFRFDYTGRYNYLRAALDFQNNNKLRWSLNTGYDIRRRENPWQDVAFRLTAHPSPKHSFAVSTGYDINRSRWRSLITNFRILDPGNLSLDVGARYDIETGKIGLARGRFDYRINDDWRIEGITSWNGATKGFDYNSLRLTRDLHCWEVSLTYNEESGFRNDRGLSLDFRIKAFPSIDRFGIGQYGQAIDTSMGQYYY